MLEETKKRKTKTSAAVKNRYAKKTYSVIRASLKKELVREFDEAIKEDEITRTEFIRRAITQYLDNRK